MTHLEATRSRYVIDHSLRVALVATILSSIVGQVSTIAVSIITSHAVSAHALSVLTLTSPIMSLVSLIANAVISGVCLQMSVAMGNQEHQRVNHLFTVGVTYVLLLGGVAVSLFASCSEYIAHFLTSEQDLLPLVKDYLPIGFVSLLVGTGFAVDGILTTPSMHYRQTTCTTRPTTNTSPE